MERTKEAYTFYTNYHKTLQGHHNLQGVPHTLVPYVKDLCELAHKHTFNMRQDHVGVYVVEYVPTHNQQQVSVSKDSLWR